MGIVTPLRLLKPSIINPFINHFSFQHHFPPTSAKGHTSPNKFFLKPSTTFYLRQRSLQLPLVTQLIIPLSIILSFQLHFPPTSTKGHTRPNKFLLLNHPTFYHLQCSLQLPLAISSQRQNTSPQTLHPLPLKTDFLSTSQLSHSLRSQLPPGHHQLN